jgi:hypothetical protein
MTIRPQSFGRMIFETPHASEYFSVREFTTLTGQPTSSFPGVSLKEIADTALDAAESVDVSKSELPVSRTPQRSYSRPQHIAHWRHQQFRCEPDKINPAWRIPAG